MKKYLFSIAVLLLLFSMSSSAQNMTAKEIIKAAESKQLGNSNQAEIKMTIIRPSWQREMTMKSWSKGTEYSLMVLTAPARDKGTGFLKRDDELWNWQPRIDRVVKMPPSMMMQSWMGSDFTNDDLVRQSSIAEDYTHKLLPEETVEGYDCYVIALTPKPDAPVVWGRVKIWVSKKEYLQLKTEFYDEDDYLVNTMLGKDVKTFDGKTLPSRLEVIPAEEEGNKTIIEYLSLSFDEKISDSFFSVQSLKRVR